MAETTEAVLDASAILAMLQAEAGAEEVAMLRDRSSVCTVNHSEVIARLVRRGLSQRDIAAVMAALTYRLVDFDADLAWRAGLLVVRTREAGLSLGDRACLALAEREGVPVLTADRVWATLDLEVEVRLVR